MYVKGCRLLKCAISVLKDTEFFIVHDERGGTEEEKKKEKCGGRLNTHKEG